MRRKTALPLTIRNGLQWRDGRPRWEPSPSNRKAGLKGLDLKDPAGAWIPDRGVAISICDGRHSWAQAIREAALADAAGDDARANLRAALEALQPPATDDARLRRHLLQDLVDHARRLLDGQDAAAGVSHARAPRSVERLVEAYFAAADDSDDARVRIKPNTRRAYATEAKKFLARFSARGVASIGRMEIFDWYHGKPDVPGLLQQHSPATANLTIGAVAAFFEFATKLDWIAASPAVRLERTKAAGRLVFITLEEERAFVAWCDANGYEDVADGFAAGLWTGARISDLCAVNLEDLGGPVWRFVPIKTEGKGQIAMPGLVPQVRARIDRRRAAAAADTVKHLRNATPFLWHPKLQRRHDTRSFWDRFVEAKADALLQDAVPESFTGKRQQDTRDTCITRLWAAGVEIARIWSWTGHSQKSIEKILKDHYLTLLEEGSLDMARKLEAWAETEALKLA